LGDNDSYSSDEEPSLEAMPYFPYLDIIIIHRLVAYFVIHLEDIRVYIENRSGLLYEEYKQGRRAPQNHNPAVANASGGYYGTLGWKTISNCIVKTFKLLIDEAEYVVAPWVLRQLIKEERGIITCCYNVELVLVLNCLDTFRVVRCGRR